MADSPETLAQVVHRIDQLEQRVWVLEQGSDAHNAHRATNPAIAAPADLRLVGWPAQPGSIFPVLGIAMLGVAGAYLLRAVAESGTVPDVAAVSLAALYAGGWLVAAAKLHAVDAFARTTYASVSALTLAPMLWESTSRFHYLSVFAAAAVLATFFAASYLVAWTARQNSVVWISSLASAAVAVVLSVATHELVPFAAVLLVMALLNEIAGGSGRWSGTRAVSAVGADLLICALLFVYSRPSAGRVEYPEVGAAVLVAAPLLLFAIYCSSVVLRVTLQERTVTYGETVQLAVSAVLALQAVLHFANAGETIVFAIGCIGLALGGYAWLFVQFAPAAERRNYPVCASFSLALMLVGCWLGLGSGWLPTVLGATAIAAAVMGSGSTRQVLSFHSLVYLIAAGQASGALGYAAHAMLGALPPQPRSIVLMILVTALFCYAAGSDCTVGNWTDRAFRLVSAAIAACAAVAMCIAVATSLAGRFLTPLPWHVALTRTLAASAVAIAMARIGSWFGRTELVRMSYASLGLLAVKLLLEDLQHGRAEFIAASIFIYALTLIAVPALARKSPRPGVARLHEASAVPMSSAV